MCPLSSGVQELERKLGRVAEEDIKIEGLSAEEILALPEEHLDALVFTGSPLAIRAGSAEILGSFSYSGPTLQMELAQIDGGGEGVLVLLTVLAKRIARRRGCEALEWVVHATDCAEPNLKLRRVLERRGFSVEPFGTGVAYRLTEKL